MTATEVSRKIETLPPDERRQVMDFVDFLAARRSRPRRTRLRLDWAGGLREFRDQFDAVELQHRALDWWGNP